MNMTKKMRQLLLGVHQAPTRVELHFKHASVCGAINMAFYLQGITLEQSMLCHDLLANAFNHRAKELN